MTTDPLIMTDQLKTMFRGIVVLTIIAIARVVTA